MIIKTELDTEENELFILAEDRMNNIQLMEETISNYINENINSKFKLYLFLCDSTWSENSRINCYKGLWKQQYIREKFGKYSNNEEKKFINDEGKIMFATYFNLDNADLPLGVSENAFVLSGHSFIFLSDKEPELETQDIFNSLDIFGGSTSGNNWEKVVEVLHNDRCIPVQRWQGGNELSLRFFLYDERLCCTNLFLKGPCK